MTLHLLAFLFFRLLAAGGGFLGLSPLPPETFSQETILNIIIVFLFFQRIENFLPAKNFLFYVLRVVGRGGIEPPTLGFSVLRSTD
jgi:hypothetical protein